MPTLKVVSILVGLFAISLGSNSDKSFKIPLDRKMGKASGSRKTHQMLTDYHQKRENEGLTLHQFASTIDEHAKL